MKLEQIQLGISGRVQGVGFRFSTEKEAKRLGLTGWVKNLPDRGVETLAEGPTEQIEAFLKWCGRGPITSRVEKVDVIARREISALSFQDFGIKR